MKISSAIVILFICIACVLQNIARAEVFSIDFMENGAISSSKPTLTFLWKSEQAKATLIFIPGGEGQLGLSPDKTDLGGFYGKTLKPLSNSNATSGLFNVVVFDSPTSLDPGVFYPFSRATPEHMLRIESVVQFYKDKFRKPIWLMGHSAGAASITEFYKYLQKNNKEKIIDGLIFSAGRSGAMFNSNTNAPLLFLTHERDGCRATTGLNSLRSYYEDFTKSNAQPVKMVVLTSGESEPGNPCRSGYHMYFNAHEEAYKAIDGFASEIVK
jgi:hypothetical protein